jgi:hypothetical protein
MYNDPPPELFFRGGAAAATATATAAAVHGGVILPRLAASGHGLTLCATGSGTETATPRPKTQAELRHVLAAYLATCQTRELATVCPLRPLPSTAAWRR